MADATEIELKLTLDPAQCDAIAASPAFGGATWKRRTLVATYFDTPEHHLARQGFSLRIRTDGTSCVQTVKAGDDVAAGLFVRGEWERPIDGDFPELDERSGPLTQMIEKASLARIVPLFTTLIDRRSAKIEAEGARIEVAIDRGDVRAGERDQSLCEIELELIEGSPDALFVFARRLGETSDLRLGVETKSDRGYALVARKVALAAKAEAIRLESVMPAGDAFARIVSACLRHYRLNETLLAPITEADAVHQARVALRRLRSAFFLFRPLLETDPRAEHFDGELRWLANQYGLVRDIDVLASRLEPADRAQLTPLREQQATVLHGVLSGPRARMLPIELIEWLSVGPWRQIDGGPVILGTGERLDRLRKRVKRHGRSLDHLDDQHLHALRKDAKKLRYAAEFFVSLYPGRKARRRLDAFLERIGELQDDLGRLNDAATAPLLLERLGLDIALPALSGKARRKLIEKAQDHVEELLDGKRFWRS